jgi:hypothetical protein
MKVSVVIHARACSQDLSRTLQALRYQTHQPFEAVVVLSGPWAFQADPIPVPFATAVHVGSCADGHLARCRNLGVALAGGEVVAFLEAGAVPDPHWLAELLAGYDSDQVAGVGGATCAASGEPFEPSRALADRCGLPVEDARPPRWGYLLPRGAQFVHLLGTDASFLRRRVEAVGGFDEEIDSFLADTDVCVRLIDRGYLLRRAERAVVYHDELPPHLAGDDGAAHRPRAAARERTYFTLRSALPITPSLESLDHCNRFADYLNQEAGRRDPRQGLPAYADEVERGLWLGISRGLTGTRKIPRVTPGAQGFRPFPSFRPLPQRLTVCLVAQGGRGEEGHQGDPVEWLARGLAARGHEVHLLVPGEGPARVTFEDGLWVRRLSLHGGEGSEPARAAAVHDAVRRLGRSRFVDVVGVPLWGGVGAPCLLDDELTCVLYLPPRAGAPVGTAAVRALERLCLRSARFVHSLGAGPLQEARREYGDLEGAEVLTIAAEGARAVEEMLRAYLALVERRKAA